MVSETQSESSKPQAAAPIEEEKTKKEATKKTEEALKPEDSARKERLSPQSPIEFFEKIDGSSVSAGPAFRRLAREFGVNLLEVKGSGRKSRIIKEDVEQYVKTKLNEKQVGGFSLATSPVIGFSKFGEIETKPLNQLSG